MKSIVIYQAYGQTAILEQNLFSVISLLKRHAGLSIVEKVVVYTDNPEYFKSYLGNHSLLQYELITPERLLKWRGAIQFVHRVKIEMLLDAAALFPTSNLLYLDGDTYFVKDPHDLIAKIDAHHSIMHEAENIVNQGKDPLSKKVAHFLKKFEFRIDGKNIKIPPTMVMWNAGVLGFSPQFFLKLKNVLDLTDQSYSKYQKHVMEQLAFSYFLASISRIQAANEDIHHYWRQKNEYATLIQKFLAQNTNLEKALQAFDQIEWPGPPAPKKSFLQRLFA